MWTAAVSQWGDGKLGYGPCLAPWRLLRTIPGRKRSQIWHDPYVCGDSVTWWSQTSKHASQHNFNHRWQLDWAHRRAAMNLLSYSSWRSTTRCFYNPKHKSVRKVHTVLLHVQPSNLCLKETLNLNSLPMSSHIFWTGHLKNMSVSPTNWPL